GGSPGAPRTSREQGVELMRERARELQQVGSDSLAWIADPLSDGQVLRGPLDGAAVRILPRIFELGVLGYAEVAHGVPDDPRVCVLKLPERRENAIAVAGKLRATGSTCEEQQQAGRDLMGVRGIGTSARDRRLGQLLEHHLKE